MVVLGWLYGINRATDAADKQAAQLNKTFEALVNGLQPLIGTAATAIQVIGYCTGFCEVAIGTARLINAVTGARAQKKLDEFYIKLGSDVSAIRDSLKAISDDIGILNNHKAQHKFAKHVRDYVRMRGDELALKKKQSDNEDGEETIDYLFVYHQGDEWRPEFHSLMEESPLPCLCGIFHNLDVMAKYLQAFRVVAGPKAVFHVLMPATSLYYVYEPLIFPAELQPMVFEGLLHNGTGLPYNYLDVPDAPPEMFHNVANVAVPVVLPQAPSRWRRVASTSAAWGAGLPAAIVSSAGGLVVGTVGIVGTAVAAPVVVAAAPAAVIGGIIVGSGVAAGTFAGVVTGLFVGKKVEDAWDRE